MWYYFQGASPAPTRIVRHQTVIKVLRMKCCIRAPCAPPRFAKIIGLFISCNIHLKICKFRYLTEDRNGKPIEDCTTERIIVLYGGYAEDWDDFQKNWHQSIFLKINFEKLSHSLATNLPLLHQLTLRHRKFFSLVKLAKVSNGLSGYPKRC